MKVKSQRLVWVDVSLAVDHVVYGSQLSICLCHFVCVSLQSSASRPADTQRCQLISFQSAEHPVETGTPSAKELNALHPWVSAWTEPLTLYYKNTIVSQRNQAGFILLCRNTSKLTLHKNPTRICILGECLVTFQPDCVASFLAMSAIHWSSWDYLLAHHPSQFVSVIMCYFAPKLKFSQTVLLFWGIDSQIHWNKEAI